MKTCIPFVVAIAALALAGCAESATVGGTAGKKLTLVKPAAVTLHRGGMAKADIQIRREDLAGEVGIRFSNLPRGVDVVETDARIVGDRGSYTLRAGDTADLVQNFSASVTATGGQGGHSVSESFDISVLEKP